MPAPEEQVLKSIITRVTAACLSPSHATTYHERRQCCFVYVEGRCCSALQADGGSGAKEKCGPSAELVLCLPKTRWEWTVNLIGWGRFLGNASSSHRRHAAEYPRLAPLGEWWRAESGSTISISSWSELIWRHAWTKTDTNQLPSRAGDRLWSSEAA